MTDVTHVEGIETVHPRSSWEDPAYPIGRNGLTPLCPWGAIDTSVIHYTAADDLIDGDPGEHAEDLPQYIRNMQQSYTVNRGFSVGYWWAVDWLGGAWQLRGYEYKSAANKYHNTHTGPILVLVDGSDRATDEAVHTIRCLIRETGRRADRSQLISGHHQLWVNTGIGTRTGCPGTGLQAQVDEGAFSPEHLIEAPKGDDMPRVVKMNGQPGAFLVTSTKTWISSPAERDQLESKYGDMSELVEADFRKAGPVVGERPRGYDAEGVA